MKKIIATFLFLMVLISSSFAQSSEHLKFKGVPIDGTLDEYVSKMKQAGFVLEGIEDGIAMLSGEFAGYSDCVVGVKTLQKLNLVHEIVVLFPPQDRWAGLSYDYERLKTMLTKKYGEPDKCMEKFDSDSYMLDGDSYKMHEVKMNNCKYYSIYNTDNGSITLIISNEGYDNSARVKLFYSDKINSDVFDAAAMEDL